jgi:ATP-dependent DNA helicase Q1
MTSLLGSQDAETVATSLQDVSNGRIRTGVYHADVADGQKEGLHRQWRDGSIQVVCATIGKQLFSAAFEA